MSIVFYAGSGSTPSWKVWLSLEHKQIPYELRMLSFQAGEHKTPAFLAVNPRGLVPAITDGDFALWESIAIVEYLEDKWPERPLLPGDARERARIRRIAMEAEFYLEDAFSGVARSFRPGGTPDPAAIEKGRVKLAEEARRFTEELRGPFFGNETPSIADFTIYPMLALVRRLESRFQLEKTELGGRLDDWMKRVEALPYYDRTYPPHWRS